MRLLIARSRMTRGVARDKRSGGWRIQTHPRARVLTGITLLDPAVGSGAFLLGALDRLQPLGQGNTILTRKRRVLQQNLFGVDLVAAAVRLTELRLWLAVIADDPAERGTGSHHSRTSTASFVRGTVCSIRSAKASTRCHTTGDRSELSRLRRAVITASGAEKQALVRRLRSVEARASGASLTAAERRARGDIADCLQDARGRDLFGQARGLDRELLARLREQRSQLRSLRQTRRRLALEGELPWFHYRSHFADVFAQGGFDVVAGNPPWLRSEKISPQIVDGWLGGTAGGEHRPLDTATGRTSPLPFSSDHWSWPDPAE